MSRRPAAVPGASEPRSTEMNRLADAAGTAAGCP